MAHLIWLFVLYIKRNYENGQVYIGMTGGLVKDANEIEAAKLVEKRDRKHHRNKDGFGIANIELFSTERDAIRGSEQLEIDIHKERGDCGNLRNSISPRNPNKAKYIAAAIRIFGDSAFTYWLFCLIS